MKKLLLGLFVGVAVVCALALPVAAQPPAPPAPNTNQKLSQCFDQNKCIPQSNANDLINLVRNVMRFMAIGVGVIIVVMFAVAGFLYETASGNSNQIARAKGMMGNLAFVLGLYLFSVAMLHWLLPGGLLFL